MSFERALYRTIKEQCFKGKAIILLGARQVGKTTLLKKLIADLKVPSRWLNADEADIKKEFSEADTSSRLLQLIGPNNKLIIIDEAQSIPNIGLKLKLIYDNYPEIQVIATGSSALDLQNKLNESMTGRKREFYMYPLSFEELTNGTDLMTEKRLLSTRLIYGSYPEVINNPGNERIALEEIVNSYLYKDLLVLDGIRKSSILVKLLQALALQVGSEVRYHELAKTIGNIDTTTVEKYITLLEKAFVIFKLPALNRNVRNEIKKGKKYYFYDNGVRNVLISKFNQIDLRDDIGALWENYLLAERMKFMQYHTKYGNKFFWRTQDQAEIDYIEENDGIINAFEFKWKPKNVRFPKSFLEGYPNHKTNVISRENYIEFISE